MRTKKTPDSKPKTEWESLGISEAEYWRRNYFELKRQLSELLDNALRSLKDK